MMMIRLLRYLSYANSAVDAELSHSRETNPTRPIARMCLLVMIRILLYLSYANAEVVDAEQSRAREMIQMIDRMYPTFSVAASSYHAKVNQSISFDD